MPPDAEQIRPVSLPPAVGDAILHAEPLRRGQANAATGGIWRVRGSAGTAILKVARRPAATDPPRAFPTSDVPTHWNYWRRESLAYETGLAATAYADAGIATPALLGIGTRPDGGIELWLADVGGTGGFGWPVPRLARFARELGVTQARWAGHENPVVDTKSTCVDSKRQWRHASNIWHNSMIRSVLQTITAPVIGLAHMVRRDKGTAET